MLAQCPSDLCKYTEREESAMKLCATVLCAVLILIACVSTVSAQTTGFGLKAGVNFSNFGGDDAGTWDSRTGYSFGGFVISSFSEMFHIQPEMLYTTKGAKTTSTFGTGDRVTSTLRFGYLEIPILGKVVIPIGNSVLQPALYAGPYMAFKLSSKLHIEGEDLDTESGYDDARSTDFGLVFGGGVGLPVRENIIGVEIRYTMGLTSFDDSDDNFSIKHNVLMVMVSFQI
jgi:hypothetical protein